jgi:hypothetical protein
MKNICGTLLLIAGMAAVANAQIAFESGLNMASLSLTKDGNSVSSSFKESANIGVLGGMRLGDHIYFEPGIFFQSGGAKLTSPEQVFSINTIDIPLFIQYKSGEKCGSRFLFGIGPDIGYNLSGSYHRPSSKFAPDSGRVFVVGTGKYDDLRKRSFSIGVNVGYLFSKHFYIRARYLAGLSNLNPTRDPNNKMVPSSFAINLGYVICRCSSKDGRDVFVREKGNHWRGLRKNKYSWHQKFFRGQ